jgi:hypothetical protein
MDVTKLSLHWQAFVAMVMNIGFCNVHIVKAYWCYQMDRGEKRHAHGRWLCPQKSLCASETTHEVELQEFGAVSQK